MNNRDAVVMKMRFPKNPYRWPIIVVACILVFYGGSVFLSNYLEGKIEQNIRSLHGTISSVELNLFARSIKVNDLEWSSSANSTNPDPHFLRLSAISATGINLYKLMFDKTLHVDDVTIDSGAIQYNKNIKPSGQKVSPSKYKLFSFKNISVNNLRAQIQTDTIASVSALLNCRLTDAHIKINAQDSLSYSAKIVEALLEKISIGRQEGMYGGTIARLHINTADQKVVMDSALLIPNFDKYEFAHRVGEQASRVSISVPQLTIEGLQFDKLIDSLFVAATIKITSADLYSFQDKRMAVRKRNVRLPMEGFLKLPWHIKVDTILVVDAHLSIEEFPEKGTASGTITFDSLNATLAGLNNRAEENDNQSASLQATALLMGSGRIKALFQFPLDGRSSYTAKGSIARMPLTKLNGVLEPLANLRIEAGVLHYLVFNFNYTEMASKGNLDIHYHDLRLCTTNKRGLFTHGLKTFFVNTIVKNKRIQSKRTAEETGIINIERDRRKYIFNVWVKSILGGLKSTIRG